MSTQISIQIEKTETGYLAYSPEVAGRQVQGDSFETVVDALQDSRIVDASNKPIWEIAQELTSAMTKAEICQLLSDGAGQHDHCIYSIPKRTS